MADSDLVITATQVKAGSDAEVLQGIAGATITAGQAVYWEHLSSKFKLADADAGSVVRAAVKGIALHAASETQPLRVQVAGTIDLGAAAAPTVGMEYVLSDTPGGICERDEIVVGFYTTVIGVGGEDNTMILGILPSGQVYSG